MNKIFKTLIMGLLLPVFSCAQDTLRIATNFDELLQAANTAHERPGRNPLFGYDFALDSGKYAIYADTTKKDEVDLEMIENPANGGSWYRRINVKEKDTVYFVDIHVCIIRQTKREVLATGVTLISPPRETCIRSAGSWTWEEFQKFFRREIDQIMAYRKSN